MSAYNNSRLFSDHFLDRVLPEQPDWGAMKADAADVQKNLLRLYRKLSPIAPKLSEAQLEERFIRPILTTLGHSFTVQAKLRTAKGIKFPDYVLFDFQDSADHVAGEELNETNLGKGGLGVGDAKYWDRQLDVPLPLDGSIDAFDASNPSSQIDFYIRQSGLPWGLLTNGRKWRLYNASSSHKLDVFYEVDLPELLKATTDDFLYFYALFRRSAFSDGPLSLDAILAGSSSHARAVSESIKKQIFDAVLLLAQGFLKYDGNKLSSDQPTLAAVYDNSLVVLYRLLFALYAEARGLLPLQESETYRADYSVRSITLDIASRVDEGRTHSPNTALVWSRLENLFALIDKGDPTLQIGAFNGGLFNPSNHPFLRNNKVGDAYLELAIDRVSRIDRQFVDYRDLETRHLGTIYEGLLEYHLQVLQPPRPGHGVDFIIDLFNDKGERKSSGSFYTPDYVVDEIIRTALEPTLGHVTAQLETELQKAEAVLSLNVLDPAMGSGHFLVAATEYLAEYLARLTLTRDSVGDGEDVDVTGWKRRVAHACIYGVDLNPLAVELAKLSLWLTTVANDRPLSFLDHHLRTGDSLLGSQLGDIAAMTVSKRRSKKGPVDAHQTSLMDDPSFRSSLGSAVTSLAALERNPGLTVADIRNQETAYREVRDTLIARHRDALDVVTAVRYGLAIDSKLVPDLVRSAANPTGIQVPQLKAFVVSARQMSISLRFFHWEIEFPDVFFGPSGDRLKEPGFDVVVGNPPYDVLAAKERQQAAGELAAFLSYAKRDPTLAPVLGGKANVFRLFVAQAVSLAKPGALAGFIVPMSLLSDQQAVALRRQLLEHHSFRRIDAFPQKDDPKRRIFPEAKLPTCVIALECHRQNLLDFDVTLHPGNQFFEISGSYRTNQRRIVKRDPVLLRIPLFTSADAAQVVEALWDRAGTVRAETLITSYQGEVNETSQAHLVSTDPTVGPVVLRGGNIDRYLFLAKPRQGESKYINEAEFEQTGGGRVAHTQEERLGYQRNAGLNSSRRLRFAPLPVPSFCFDSVAYIPIREFPYPNGLLVFLNSDVAEWVFRSTSTNNHVSTQQVHDLPLLALPRANSRQCRTLADSIDTAIKKALRDNPKRAPLSEIADRLLSLENDTCFHAVIWQALEVTGTILAQTTATFAAAFESFELDLEGELGDQTSSLSRLWTPLRGDPSPEAADILGARASEKLELRDAGSLTETQFKWLLANRLGAVSNLSGVIASFRKHRPVLGNLQARLNAAEFLADQIVSVALGIKESQLALIRRELASDPGSAAISRGQLSPR